MSGSFSTEGGLWAHVLLGLGGVPLFIGAIQLLRGTADGDEML